MNKAPAKQDPKKAKAANAPQNPSVKAPAPKPVETVKDTLKSAEVSVSKTASDAGKKAENIIEEVIKKVDAATDSLVSSLGVKNFPKVPATDADKRRTMLIIYALYAASLFTFGLTAVFAYLLYVRKMKPLMKNNVWESHLVWLDRTFLLSAGATIVGILLYGWFGWLIPLAALIFLLYRTIKGYLRYDENKPVEAPLAYY